MGVMELVKSIENKKRNRFIFMYRKGCLLIGFCGHGLRAKNLKIAPYTGGLDGVRVFWNWVYIFGTVR